jgi:Tol biopolymer transport system component
MNMTIRSTSTSLLAAIATLAGTAHAQTTTRESLSSAGVQGNFHSTYPTISGDGRFVAFESSASNLVAGDTNFRPDCFVRDRLTGQTTRVSVSSAGVEGLGNAQLPSISSDGRFVAFMSDSMQLVAGGTPGIFSVFVHDRQTGQTTRVSTATGGVAGNLNSRQPSISADGTVVVFESSANNLVSGDTNGFQDVFVHDRGAGTTTRVSVSSAGAQGNDHSGGDPLSRPRVSADGRFVAFQSRASNLVANDTSGASDIFVHDRQTGQTTRVSVSSAGQPATGDSINPSISADGRFVAFWSGAGNLVPGDSNGAEDIFVHDRQAAHTTRVSVSSSGTQANAFSSYPAISANGRMVAFWSIATNLTAGYVNTFSADVYVHDRQSGQTTLASTATNGTQGNGDSREPEISADGRFVAFHSLATTLVAADTNGFYDIFVRDLGPLAIVGDLNGDGMVDGADLGALLGSWGPCAGCPADLNGDGSVDGADLGILLGNWT